MKKDKKEAVKKTVTKKKAQLKRPGKISILNAAIIGATTPTMGGLELS